MMIRMSHPEHGFTHVYDDREHKERLAKGWKEAPEETVVQESQEKPKRKYVRKAQA